MPEEQLLMRKISSMKTDEDAPKNLYSGSYMSNTMKNYLDKEKYKNPYKNKDALEPPNPESLMVKQIPTDLYMKPCEPFEVKPIFQEDEPLELRVAQSQDTAEEAPSREGTGDRSAPRVRSSFDRNMQKSLELQVDPSTIRNSRIYQRKLS